VRVGRRSTISVIGGGGNELEIEDDDECGGDS
jgi:hypothetical protein